MPSSSWRSVERESICTDRGHSPSRSVPPSHDNTIKIPVSVLHDRIAQRLEDHDFDRIAPVIKMLRHVYMTRNLMPDHLDAIGLFVLGPPNGL